MIPLCTVNDLPARSLLLEMKATNGYHSCTFCTLKGCYKDSVLYWPYLSIESQYRRTMDNFIIHCNNKEMGVTGRSVLMDLKQEVNIIDMVAIDYMHMNLEG